MNVRNNLLVILLFAAAICAVRPVIASDDIFFISGIGEVEFNLVNNGPLGNVAPGDFVIMSCEVNAQDFEDSPSFPTRGYLVDQASFELNFGSATTLTLQDPFPSGQVPYFVIRNDDPAVDGFFVANSFDFPTGVPLSQTGQFGQFRNNFSVTYTGDTLESFDISQAFGTYTFDGLTVFNWTITDGAFDALGINFTELSIVQLLGCLPGDLNLDCEVGLLDVAPFVEALSTSTYSCEADINDDGEVSLLDVAPFVKLLTGG